MDRMRWIVVGMDFSEGSDRALEHAIKLASESGASLACVHAFEDPLVGLASLDDPTPTMRSELADAVARSSARGSGIHVELIVRRGHRGTNF